MGPSNGQEGRRRKAASRTQHQPLDLFYLTFNAGKAFISVSVFGKHLSDAFKQGATQAQGTASLPELVVFSLQEMAPLHDAFRGPYYLDPYFSCYESALNMAAAKYASDELLVERPRNMQYTLVKKGNVGMTGIMLFARDPTALQDVRLAEVGFGAGDMSNKGAVGLRMMFRKGKKETELTFVSTHLAAMEWNLEYRNRNWATIVSDLVFADPKAIAQVDVDAHTRDGENDPLMHHPDTQKALRDVSIYKPGSHLFVAGDLNYRLSGTSPPAGATFPVMDPDSVDHYPRFLARDQLTAEKAAFRTLHGLSEAPIHFPPTYKYSVLDKHVGKDDENQEVRWKFATHRWPGWCDRVLYLDLPHWVEPGQDIQPVAYDCLPVVRTSDHRAVFLRALVPILPPSELKPSSDDITDVFMNDGNVDPRIQLPYPINVDAMAHRAAVKRWEYIIGWAMTVSLSKQTFMVLSTTMLLGLATWWYTRTT